ncbi:hypothetical protein AB0A77_33225 [Streptomyces varsoviensis]|uniref:hypothetical protein n=1 Tax=Streptomyces varsoviensis TaxID=67373 RepID=UPI0033DEDD15
MRLSTHDTVQRIWTVQLHAQPGGPLLSCPHCTLPGYRVQASSARSAALTHLARHAQRDALPGHLRTCQCRARGCSWHPRRRGCAGPVLLALTCDRSGRMWRLADACAACAAATRYTAVVPDTLPGPAPAQATSRTARRSHPPHGPGERLRVRETLTYLAAALPRFSSPAARLLALQCALRADHQGHVRLPHGLLLGMRLRGRTELWSELEHAGWLACPALRNSPLEARLLDAAMQSQTSGRSARARAAHWALRPTPLATPRGMAPSVQLTALTLAAHTCDGTGSAELDVLTRLCGQSPQQLEDLLDQLVRSRLLADWRHISDEEISWRLPSQIAVGRTAVQQRWHGCQLRRSKPCRSSCALCSMSTPCW